MDIKLPSRVLIPERLESGLRSGAWANVRWNPIGDDAGVHWGVILLRIAWVLG